MLKYDMLLYILHSGKISTPPPPSLITFVYRCTHSLSAAFRTSESNSLCRSVRCSVSFVVFPLLFLCSSLRLTIPVILQKWRKD